MVTRRIHEADTEAQCTKSAQPSGQRNEPFDLPVQLMLKFCILQLDLSFILHKQHEANRSKGARWTRARDRQLALKAAPGVGAQATSRMLILPERAPSERSSSHSRFCLAFYLLCVVKYCLIGALANGLLSANLGWLDCALMGRLRFVGRANKIGDEIVVCFLCVCSVYRLYVASPAGDRFGLQSLEFLLCGRDELEEQPSPGARLAPRLSGPRSRSFDETRPPNSGSEQWWRQDRRRRFGPTTVGHGSRHWASPSKSLDPNRHLHVRMLTWADGRRRDAVPDERPQWVLRPNRTHECWRKLRSLTRCSFYYLALVVIGTLLGASQTLLGAILTDFGFELSYPTCVAWIRREQQAALERNESTRLLGQIYRVEPAHRRLATEMPLEQLPLIVPLTLGGQVSHELRPYNLLRLALDLAENLVIYLECVALFVALTYVVLVNSLDIVLNANRISGQLEQLIARLIAHNATRRPPGLRLTERLHLWDTGLSSACHWATGRRQLERELEELVGEVTQAQATLQDHFCLVRGYNHLYNFVLALMCLNWALYTIVLCGWMQLTKNRAIGMEFFAVETCGTLTVLAFIAVAAVVHSRNLHLYRQISRLMALDDCLPLTKLRWTTLMKFYYPKPLFCFSLHETIGISRLFCIKLISWVGSGFIILANFFYTIRN